MSPKFHRWQQASKHGNLNKSCIDHNIYFVVSRKISLDIRNIRQAIEKKHITTCTYIPWRSKWRRLLQRPFQNVKDFIDSLCQKFPTLAQGTFHNEVLKFSDIEQWNLESSFFESPYFLALIFAIFGRNNRIVTSSLLPKLAFCRTDEVIACLRRRLPGGAN